MNLSEMFNSSSSEEAEEDVGDWGDCQRKSGVTLRRCGDAQVVDQLHRNDLDQNIPF